MNLLTDLNLLGATYINWHSFTFLFFALLACGFGAAVLATSNVVRMAFYLTLSLGATAGLFFLAGAEFVGAMQLMQGRWTKAVWPTEHTAHLEANFSKIVAPATLLATGTWIAGIGLATLMYLN